MINDPKCSTCNMLKLGWCKASGLLLHSHTFEGQPTYKELDVGWYGWLEPLPLYGLYQTSSSSKTGKKNGWASSTKRTNHGLNIRIAETTPSLKLGGPQSPGVWHLPVPSWWRKRWRFIRDPQPCGDFLDTRGYSSAATRLVLVWVAKTGFWTSLFGANIYC